MKPPAGDLLPPIGDSPEERLLALHVNEIQLLLAEKRTALSVLRTGIAIMALPISVLSVLIATSRLYDLARVLPLLVPVVLVNLALAGLAVFLVVRSLRRLVRLDRLVATIKRENPRLNRLIT
jgi:uncharacterized membrane protein YidH (DUF202 family)